jgi:hypothetical protein
LAADESLRVTTEENVSSSNVDHATNVVADGDRWGSLYRIGAVAALISVVIILLSIITFFTWPTFPDDILVVIQQDKLAGLMGLDFMYLLGSAFGLPFFLVLYVTLKEIDPGWALVALVLGLVGLVCLVPARPILEMFALSEGYAAATTDTQRAICQAAAEGMLTHFRGTAYHLHYIFGSVSLLISALLMLRSELFGRATAIVGLVTNVVVFGLYVPEVGVYISLLSVVGYLIWYIQIARRLIPLGWGGSTRETGV